MGSVHSILVAILLARYLIILRYGLIFVVFDKSDNISGIIMDDHIDIVLNLIIEEWIV